MLKLMFCTNDKFKAELIEHTANMINGSFMNARIDTVMDSPEQFIKLIERTKEDDVLALFLCDSYGNRRGLELALEVRLAALDAYIVYFAQDEDKLLKLTNDHIRLSGFLHYSVDHTVYDRVIANIYSQYTRKMLREDKQFTLIVGKQLQVFSLDEIILFESLNKKINMTTINAQVSFYDTLASLGERLQKRFMRCHNSYLINVGLIERISINDMTITLKDSIKVPISQTHKETVIQFIKNYKAELSR